MFRRYPTVQILLDKMHLSDDEEEDGATTAEASLDVMCMPSPRNSPDLVQISSDEEEHIEDAKISMPAESLTIESLDRLEKTIFGISPANIPICAPK